MRKVRSLLAFSMLLLVAGLMTAQAQVRDLNDGDVFPDRGIFDRLPVTDVMLTLCHIPPENPSSAHTIQLAQAAAPAHMAHGDVMGECPYQCDGPPAPSQKTGQTECWDALGFPVDCVGTGHDGENQTGISVDPRFTSNGDGTVTDNLTGLTWFQDVACLGLRKWHDALSDTAGLADGICGLMDGSTAGDWRLPSIKELLSLVDYGELDPSLPVGHPFSDPYPSVYWSSTTYESYPRHAWTVTFSTGSTSNYNKTNTWWVWPVRGPE